MNIEGTRLRGVGGGGSCAGLLHILAQLYRKSTEVAPPAI